MNFIKYGKNIRYKIGVKKKINDFNVCCVGIMRKKLGDWFYFYCFFIGNGFFYLLYKCIWDKNFK